jgi:hypothetical protein
MTSDPKVKAKRPKVRGLKMPRLATPRLGLSTKGMPATNPYGANKMTIKTGSLAAYRYEMLLEKQASGQISLREFVQLQEYQKTAGLQVPQAGAAAFQRIAMNAAKRFGGPAKVSRPTVNSGVSFTTQPPAVRPATTQTSTTVPPPAAAGGTAATPPAAAGAGTPNTQSADGLLSRVARVAPIGVAGGMTAYGGFRGWGEGQAEVAKAQQQSFNPRGVF